MASTALNRASGVYSSSFATKSIASGAVRGRKTYKIPSQWLCNTVAGCYPTTYLGERVRLDLWELVLHVVRVHCLDLLPRWSAEHFDDLDQLVDSTLPWEERLPKHQLRHDAPSRPDVCLQKNVSIN